MDRISTTLCSGVDRDQPHVVVVWMAGESHFPALGVDRGEPHYFHTAISDYKLHLEFVTAEHGNSFLLFLIFSHFYVGSMCLMRRLHLARSCMSSLDNSFSDKSFPMVSINLRFGLPLLLFPGTSIPITLLPTYSSSLLNTCPYHFNLLSCTFLDISPTVVVPLIISFLISW